VTGLYDKVITRAYATGGVIGRPSGFDTGADYSVTYGYDTTGLFNAVTWNAGGTTLTATYSYIPNSDLLYQLTLDNGLRTAYSYEPKAKVITI